MDSSDSELKILKLLEENPNLTQREVAEELGVSLGKTHYLIRALIDKGFLKLSNFKNSENKIAYLYLLTPKGILQRTELTKAFLSRKKHLLHLKKLSQALLLTSFIISNDYGAKSIEEDYQLSFFP